MRPPRLSLIVVAQNEEEDLPACLASAAPVADEMIVVDGGSTDRTAELARSFGARVVAHPFENFAAQKQFALEQAGGEWVLSLDADERLTPSLAEELKRLLEAGDGSRAGFRLPFEVEFMGRRLKHGGLAGEEHLRLFRRERGRFGGGVLHEGVELDGPSGLLLHAVRHRPYRDLSDYLDKLDRYTGLWASKARAAGRRSSALDHLVLPLEFLKRYFIQAGFLDGGPGFAWCALSAYHAWLKRLKLLQLEEADRRSQ